MNHYYTIQEFANLRNIHINSLRYYEKIGILKPAYINPENHYRYYLTEQLLVLNQIILCTKIGIPLKEIEQYIDASGNLQSKKLLEYGQNVAMKKFKEIQENLDLIKYMLDEIEINTTNEKKEDLYIKEIKKRKVLTTDYYEEWMSPMEAATKIAEIYNKAQKQGILPILPAGQLLKIDSSGRMKYRYFIEILDIDIDNMNYEILPEGKYLCKRTNAKPGQELFQCVKESIQIQNQTTIIIANIKLEKYSYTINLSEIQMMVE